MSVFYENIEDFLLCFVFLFFCFSVQLTSEASILDVRGGYRSGSHAYETRLKVSEG